MSGEQRRPGVPQGPPWALDLLADLHAEALDADTARELSPLVRRDPAAAEILAGLDATRHDMAALPPLRMPDEVTDRICTALATEAESAAPVVELDPVRRRRRRLGWAASALAAAAAVLAVLIISPMLRTSHQVTSTPEALPSAPPMTFSGGNIHLDRTQLTEALHSRQYAPTLSDPRTLQGCLRANSATAQPIGAQTVSLDGRTAQMLILPTGAIGRFRVLVVGLDCGPGHPAAVSDDTFGG
jgi:hypothetical protein